jgi:DNA-binding transcriptional LysR family regulator
MAGFQPDVRHTTDDYVVVQNFVGAGLAVALLPALALAAAPNPQVAAVRIDGGPVRQVSLAHRKEFTAVPAVTAAIHALAAVNGGLLVPEPGDHFARAAPGPTRRHRPG